MRAAVSLVGLALLAAAAGAAPSESPRPLPGAERWMEEAHRALATSARRIPSERSRTSSARRSWGTRSPRGGPGWRC